MTTPMPPTFPLPFLPSRDAVFAADPRRLFPAISLRVRASLTRRRLALKNSLTRTAGASRSFNHDVRPAA